MPASVGGSAAGPAPSPGGLRGEREAVVPLNLNGHQAAPSQPFQNAFVEMVDTLQKREVELYAAEERYRSMVEAIPAVVYAVRPDAAFSTTYISPYVETLLGIPPRQWMNDPDAWHRAIHPEDRDRVMSEWRRRIYERGPSVCEYRLAAGD